MTKEEYLSRIANNKAKEKETVLRILRSFVDCECKEAIEWPLRANAKGSISFESNSKVAFAMRHYDDAAEMLQRMLKENYPFLNFCIPYLKVGKQFVNPPTMILFDLSKEEGL